MANYSVCIYCPDSHLVYDITSLEKHGVGGGVTSRIRIAHELARQGNQVTLYNNCPKEGNLRGVTYRHHTKFDLVKTDIFIASSSGGNFDLGEINSTNINARLKILLVHGIRLPANVHIEDFDFLYFPSNFSRQQILNSIPGLDVGRIFVARRGVEEGYFHSFSKNGRNTDSLVFVGHPAKGLESAISILQTLQAQGYKYSLEIYGGNELWGGQKEAIPLIRGVIDHGMVGQKILAKRLQKMDIALHLQSIEEAGGPGINESLRAGCIVFASAVGMFPEIIQNGFNGFIIPGEHTDPNVRLKVVDMIRFLRLNPEYVDFIRQNAVRTPFSWETIVKAWTGHWDWYFSRSTHKNSKLEVFPNGCSLCNGILLPLADGLHCVECGHYQQSSHTNLRKEWE